MSVMRLVGGTHPLPPHASVHETEREYVIELDVADFAAAELTVEMLGPQVTVRGEQVAAAEDAGKAFRLRERLEETFRLPDDVDLAGVRARFRYGSLHIHAPKTTLAPRRVPVETRTALTGNPDAVPC